MRKHGIVPSMGAIASPWDNAVTESLMSTIKVECIHRKTFQTREEAKLEIFSYMEQFYKATKNYRHGDVNLSNFILVNREVVGIDFEQAVIQEPIKDMVDVICSGLFYEPILTDYKKTTVALWVLNHPWRKHYKNQQWLDELSDAMHRLNQRRKTDYDLDWNFIFKT